MADPIIDPRLDDLVIRVEDMLAAGHCVAGVRSWFAHYGFDFRHVLKHGIPARDALMTGDAHAIAVVKAKLDRMSKEQ